MKFGCKWISSLEDTVKNSHILIIQALAKTLTLKIVNNFFCKTLRLMIICHHTQFASKWFSDSGDIVRTKDQTQTGGMDRRTHRQTEAVIPLYPPT